MSSGTKIVQLKKEERKKKAFDLPACQLEFGENLFFFFNLDNLTESGEKICNHHFSLGGACCFRKTHQLRGESREEN